MNTDTNLLRQAVQIYQIDLENIWNVTFVPTWKIIRPVVIDQQSTQISHYVSTE